MNEMEVISVYMVAYNSVFLPLPRFIEKFGTVRNLGNNSCGCHCKYIFFFVDPLHEQ